MKHLKHTAQIILLLLATSSLAQATVNPHPQANQTTYGYDNVGNRSHTTHANGNQDSYTYDALNRLTELTTKNSASSLLTSYTYTLDASGKRTNILEATGHNTAYVYDTLNRLSSETLTDAVNGNYSASYSYDKVGNRTEQTIDGVQTQYTYDNNNRLSQQGGTTYGYDNNGSTLTETLDGNTTQYQYNAKNQLSQLTDAGQLTHYQYNIDGIRTQQSTGANATDYLIDSNRPYAQVIQQRDNGIETVRYTYGDDLLSQTRGGITSSYHYDGLGSTRSLSDSTGLITDSYHYDAYGELLSQTGTTENDYLFTGEQRDSTLGQYYLRARYYDQGIGRFTQQDTWMGNSIDPVTLHKYVYGNLDPVNNTDPSGRFSMGSVGASINIIGNLALRNVATAGRFVLGKGKSTINFIKFMAGQAPQGARVTWGFWRDLPKAIRAGKEYASIRSRFYTREAVNRMTPGGFGSAAGGQAARGVPPMAVEEVILFGSTSRTFTKAAVVRTIYTLGRLRVVTEEGGKIIITVIKIKAP